MEICLLATEDGGAVYSCGLFFFIESRVVNQEADTLVKEEASSALNILGTISLIEIILCEPLVGGQLLGNFYTVTFVFLFPLTNLAI